MGAYLSKANKTTEVEDGGNARLTYGAASMQGWRVKQEDAHNAIPDFSDDWSLFAVYDGHGGVEVSQFTAAHFPDMLKTQLEALNVTCAELAKALPTTSSTIVNDLPMKTTMARAAESSSEEEDEVDESVEKENHTTTEAKVENGDVNGVKAEGTAESNGTSASPMKASESPKKENGASPVKDGAVSPKKENGASATKEGVVSPKKETNGDSHVNDDEDEVDTRPKQAVDVSAMLSSVFLEFDDLLRQPPAMRDLKQIAGKESDAEENGISMEEERADAAELFEEANMPLQEVLKQYGVMLVKNRKGAKFLTSENNARNLAADDAAEVDAPKQPSNKRKTSDVVVEEKEQVDVETDAKRAKVDADAGDEPVDDEPRRSFSVGPIIEPSSDATESPTTKTSPRQRSSKSECLSDQKYASAANNSEKIMKIYEEASKMADGKAPDSPETLTAVEFDEEETAAASASASVGDVCAQSDESSNDGDYVDKDSSDEVEEGDGDEDDSSDDDAVDGEGEPDEQLHTLKQMFTKGGMAAMLARRLAGHGEDSDSSSDDDDMTPVMNMPSGDTPGEDSGCTACVVLVAPSVVCVANVGDSRAVMCRGGECVELSLDHKPDDPIETRRIRLAGGKITPDGRVNGGLNLSRAMGDHFYKKTTALPLSEQMITAKPDVLLQRLTSDDEFLVIACDGIWNSLSSADVIAFVRSRLSLGETPHSIAEQLCFECLAPNTDGDGTGCDNMTVVVVLLNHAHVPKVVNGDSTTTPTK